MNNLERVEHWGDTHHPKWVDIVRIALGIFLCYKGIDFLRNMSVMTDLLASHLSFGSFVTIMLGHYIVFAHILGGIFLAMGVLTPLRLPYSNSYFTWCAYYGQLVAGYVAPLLTIVAYHSSVAVALLLFSCRQWPLVN